MKRELSKEAKRARIDHDFSWIRKISTLMDSQFKIGRFRFGLDPILNFVPFGGAIAGFGISLVLVIAMWRNGTSPRLILRMMINIALDAVLGAIPLFGTVFDFFSKANDRNIKLLEEHYYQGKHQGNGIGLIFILLGVILLVIVGVIWMVFGLMAMTVDYLSNIWH